MPYAGLPRATPTFLTDLAHNNDRNWFEIHRADYVTHWLEAGLDLIAALASPCAAMRPRLLAVPKLNQSLRRIHRDTRFSVDKTPYQPCLHVILSTGPAFNKAPGFHLVLTPEGLSFGAGQYGFDPVALDRVRRRTCDPSDRVELLAAIAAAGSVGSRLDAPDLARVPKGYESEPDWDHLLRRKSLIVRTPTAQRTPDWLFTPEAPRWVARLATSHLPLLDWLLR